MSITASDALHRRAIVVDGHCDTPYRLLRHNVHLDEHDTEAQADLKTLLASGITATFFASYVPPFYAGRGAFVFANRLIDIIEEETSRLPEKLTLTVDADGIRAAKREGKPDTVGAFVVARGDLPAGALTGAGL